jgi:hypothetical protein
VEPRKEEEIPSQRVYLSQQNLNMTRFVYNLVHKYNIIEETPVYNGNIIKRKPVVIDKYAIPKMEGEHVQLIEHHDMKTYGTVEV